MEILMGQAQELLELLQKLVLPGAGLAGSFGKGTESSKHDVDVLLEGCEPTEELKVRLVNILRPKSVEDTDCGGWYMSGTIYGDVGIFFTGKDFDR